MMAQVVISLEDNGMVVLSKVMDGYTLPVIWFENLDYFDGFIKSAMDMSMRFHYVQSKQLPPVIHDFIEQLDITGI